MVKNCDASEWTGLGEQKIILNLARINVDGKEKGLRQDNICKNID
jgi:hypothetical protein